MLSMVVVFVVVSTITTPAAAIFDCLSKEPSVYIQIVSGGHAWIICEYMFMMTVLSAIVR